MENRSSVLVVDDAELERMFLKRLLEKAGYRVSAAADGAVAIRKIKENIYDLVITDLKLGDHDGMDVLKAAKVQSSAPEVILITAYGTIESTVKAMKLNAFDYLTKPLDSERVLGTVRQALERRKLKNEVKSLRTQLVEKYSHRNIITISLVMKNVLAVIDQISRTDSTVLLEGESGTGKELIAKAIHFGGQRAGGPFITLNCAALPEPLLESELFGHVKGAFTGAIREKKGLMEEADGGTLLLDEIGNMPPGIQVKLLRVFEDGKVRKVGSNRSIDVDVRLIASTNRKLSVLMKEGSFREDLFYRLNVIPVTLPPLRERKEDIRPLVNHFIKIYSRKLKKDIEGFSPDALNILLKYDWPGNVRELENFVERSVVLCSSPLIMPSDITADLQFEGSRESRIYHSSDLNLREENERLEKECILVSLIKNDWNRIKAAKELSISRSSLWRKMKKYDINKTNAKMSQ